MPERLRGSTRNRIRNACVGSNPAVCALLFFFCSSPSWGKDGWLLRPMDSVGRFLTFGKDEGKKREKFRKKKKKKHHRHQNPSLISTHVTKRGTRTLSLSLLQSLSKESLGFFSSVSRRAETRRFSRVFFSRARPHTPHARVVGRLPAQKEQKKTRKIIAPTGTRATRLADSTRAKRGERMRSNPFFLSFGFETVSMYGWVPASVEASSS